MLILTFDIEDWFNTNLYRKHYSGHIWDELPSRVEENTSRILEFLDEHDQKATFFILGWVAERHPKLIKTIADKGHDIGAHSTWHHDIRKLTPENFEKDLKRNLGTIEDITGDKVLSYRAPDFSLSKKNTEVWDILYDNGIRYDSSLKIYSLKESYPFSVNTTNGEILEFPLYRTVFGFPYSGGGYFRVLPKQYLDILFRKNEYNMVYMHPKDIALNLPSINIFTLFRNWFNRYKTSDTLNKLSDLMVRQKVLTIHEAADYWNKR